MKSTQKFLLLFFCLLFSAPPLEAQKHESRLGFIAGPGITSTRTLNDYKWKPLYGYSGGIFFQQKISRFLALELNVLYENKNFTAQARLYDYLGVQIGSTNYRISFSSVSLPLMLNLSSEGRTRILWSGGFYMNYLLQNSSFVKNYNGEIIKTTYNVNEQNKFDTGLTVGLGFSRQFSQRTSLLVVFRNYFGMHNMNSAYPVDKFYLNYHTILIGLNYKLGRIPAKAVN